MTAKSSPVMLRPWVVAGTAMAAISGADRRGGYAGNLGVGASRAASSRPRAAVAARVWAASAACSDVGAVREPPSPPVEGSLAESPAAPGSGALREASPTRGADAG